MFKYSPRRNQRNKGFKVKHALQICVLVGVCIWLLYQVQHSRTKKASYEQNTSVSEKVQSENDVIRLGRKDLQPQKKEEEIDDEKLKEVTEEEEGKSFNDDTKVDEHDLDLEKSAQDSEQKGDSVDEDAGTEKIHENEARGEDNAEAESKENTEDGKGESNEEATDMNTNNSETREEESEKDQGKLSGVEGEENKDQEIEKEEKDVKENNDKESESEDGKEKVAEGNVDAETDVKEEKVESEESGSEDISKNKSEEAVENESEKKSAELEESNEEKVKENDESKEEKNEGDSRENDEVNKEKEENQNKNEESGSSGEDKVHDENDRTSEAATVENGKDESSLVKETSDSENMTGTEGDGNVAVNNEEQSKKGEDELQDDKNKNEGSDESLNKSEADAGENKMVEQSSSSDANAAGEASNGSNSEDISEAGEADVNAAVAAARAAFEGSWGSAGPYTRSKLLWKLADLIERDLNLFAALESLDNGKPFLESSTADLPLVIQTFRYYAGAADKLHGNTLDVGGPLVDESFTAYSLHEPVGVVGQIIPWNFPLMMAAWKLGPALATGCTVVLKLAEQTPLTGLYLGKVIKEAGFPPGVVNIITGFGGQASDGTMGAGLALLRHPDVNKIAFTGSSAVGRIVMRECAEQFKRVTLELGGKSPNIIFPDADLDGAVAGTLVSQFFNQGQVCCAGSRTFVHEDVYEEFIEKLQAAAKERQKLGDPLHPETTQGPQISEEQFNQILKYIDIGKNEGAKCLFGGKREGTRGYFIQPTAFVDVKEDMRIWKEEIFGPVMAITKFRTMDEAIAKANDSIYGLAAAIWTKDLGTAQYMQKRLRAGTVWINCYNVFDANMAFGGFKSSGIGRELGKYALENYTEVKSVCMKSVPTFE